MPPHATGAVVPLYLDWEFWSAVIAWAALILSQLPPVRVLFTRRSLSLEANENLGVSHMVGYPTAQVYISLRNTGNRPVRVAAMSVEFRRVDETPFSLGARQFFVNIGDPRPVLFVPVTIEPGHEWGHVAAFEVRLDQQENRRIRSLRNTLREDISAKVDAQRRANPNDNRLCEGEPANVQALLDVYAQKFRWVAGDYAMVVRVESDSAKPVESRFRFTVYESDERELRGFAERYKYGEGPAFDSLAVAGVIVPLFAQL